MESGKDHEDYSSHWLVKADGTLVPLSEEYMPISKEYTPILSAEYFCITDPPWSVFYELGGSDNQLFLQHGCHLSGDVHVVSDGPPIARSQFSQLGEILERDAKRREAFIQGMVKKGVPVIHASTE